MKVFIASFRKQVRDFLRYPNYILKSFFYTPVTYILPFYFLLRTSGVGFEAKTSLNVLLSIILWQYMEFSVVETCNISNRELNIGTVDMIYTLPIPKIAWILGTSIVPGVLFFLSAFIFMGLLLILYPLRMVFSIGQLVPAILLIFLQTIFFSVVVFVLNLRYKKIFNTLLLLMNIFYILSGVLYPITELPEILRLISKCLPFTSVFSLLRGEAMQEGWLIWCAFVNLIYMILSVVLYQRIQKELKVNGDLSVY